MDYVLGYTACNDVSSRTSQFAQSQWCFSKGFDGSCPLGTCSPSCRPPNDVVYSCLPCYLISWWMLMRKLAGPTLLSAALVPDPSAFRVRGLKNGEVLQDCGAE